MNEFCASSVEPDECHLIIKAEYLVAAYVHQIAVAMGTFSADSRRPETSRTCRGVVQVSIEQIIACLVDIIAAYPIAITTGVFARGGKLVTRPLNTMQEGGK